MGGRRPISGFPHPYPSTRIAGVNWSERAAAAVRNLPILQRRENIKGNFAKIGARLSRGGKDVSEAGRAGPLRGCAGAALTWRAQRRRRLPRLPGNGDPVSENASEGHIVHKAGGKTRKDYTFVKKMVCWEQVRCKMCRLIGFAHTQWQVMQRSTHILDLSRTNGTCMSVHRTIAWKAETKEPSQ
ncbi:hypothetical protein NDU88_004857 [Pleurodeles waltl]|uniref:Uncharacterized protein n=1 Tax=Pleurodeles waltl TaxID=8319 RepID=A0AAV7TT61_PLEWA|nr:hypothetical protein NDU88_004857 [Pleurodeles waltl]